MKTSDVSQSGTSVSAKHARHSQRLDRYARQNLNKRPPDPNGLTSAITRLHSSRAELARWRKPVEECFRLLSPAEKKKARSAMFTFYYGLEDFRYAGKFKPYGSRKWINVPAEMEIYLATGQFVRAEELANWCEKQLDSEKLFRYENPLRIALGRYAVHKRDYDRAIEHLSSIDRKGSWVHEADIYLVELRIAAVLKEANRRLNSVEASLKVPLLHDSAPLLRARQRLRRILGKLSSAFPELT